MVRAMSLSRVPGLAFGAMHMSRLPRWGMVVGCAVAMLMAGCASGPGRSGGAGATGGTVVQTPSGPLVLPPVVARTGPASPSERDGPPPAGEAPTPAQLATLPDPVPQVEPIREGGPNKPYSVLGQSYEPIVKDVAVKERGLASWYGKKFHGRRTASGELFSMYGISAAHRTLPIPSYARVTDVQSGKSIIVRINDRGPFHSARVMDLSYAAAAKLGILGKGSAEIEVERLTFEDIRKGVWRRDDEPAMAVAPLVPPEPQLGSLATSPVPAAGAVVPVSPSVEVSAEAPAKAFTPFSKGFWVQLAALGQRDGVDRLQQRIATDMQNLLPLLAVYREAQFFKLQVGPYSTRAEAVAAAEQARTTLSVRPMVIERR